MTGGALTALYFLGLYALIPIALARLFGARWRQVFVAYGIWFALLALFALSTRGAGHSWDESIGWPIIMGMFLTIPAIPILTTAIKATGLLRRAFAPR